MLMVLPGGRNEGCFLFLIFLKVEAELHISLFTTFELLLSNFICDIMFS